MADPDVVVLGSGPNGLTAACLLAEAGLRVLVLEAEGEFGGAVKTAEVTLPGFRHDLYSGFYPLFEAGPIGQLPLERHGLRWERFARPFGGGTPNGPGVTLGRTPAESAELFGQAGRHDRDGFVELWAWWRWGGQLLLDLLFNPLGAPGPSLRAAARLRHPRKLLELAHLMASSARLVAEESFDSDDARVWFVGSALHSDLAPEASGGGAFSLAFLGLGQQAGMPVPRGGAAGITVALLSYLRSLGGEAMTGQRAREIVVRGGRAVAVRTERAEFPASRAVLATVEPQQLFLRLVDQQHLPASFVRQIRRFRWGLGTLKLDLALSDLPQFKAETLQGTGVLHLAESSAALGIGVQAASRGYLPAQPLLIAGIHTLADESRAPVGQHTFWAESRVPYEIRGDVAGKIGQTEWGQVKEAFADRMIDVLEQFAPGSKQLVLGRSVLSPVDLERANLNLVRGDITGGSFELAQQLVFRPVPGWFNHRSPLKRLYMGGAATHPGGGVHGAAGANAAKVLLADLKLAELSAGIQRAGAAVAGLLSSLTAPHGRTPREP